MRRVGELVTHFCLHEAQVVSLVANARPESSGFRPTGAWSSGQQTLRSGGDFGAVCRDVAACCESIKGKQLSSMAESLVPGDRVMPRPVEQLGYDEASPVVS
jgi:hypothetical protein